LLDEVIEMREEICTECQGTGYVVVARDYYSASYGYYLQDERPVVCRRCGGTGYVEVLEEEAGCEEAA
jgi:RecJ-like exonuclease